MMMLGTKIKEMRLKKNIKQVELARMAGISNTYLSDIEKGRTKPSIEAFLRIAEALDIKDLNIFLKKVT